VTAPPPLDACAALFIDVDGTLLDIAPAPELVEVPAGLPALLQRLAVRHEGALALVSGRRLADLDRLLVPWHGAAAGLHGAERRRPDGSLAADMPSDEAEQAAQRALDRIREPLAEAARHWPGVRLEDKGRTLALHYRLAPAREDEARGLAERLLAAAGPALRLIAGKMVLEFQPRHHGKDRAIAAFMAEPPFRGRPPVFLGDDTTDEDGFAEVNRRGGLSVRVGPPAATAARYALPSPAAVRDWLMAGCRNGGSDAPFQPQVATGGQSG